MISTSEYNFFLYTVKMVSIIIYNKFLRIENVLVLKILNKNYFISFIFSIAFKLVIFTQNIEEFHSLNYLIKLII